MTSSNRVGCVTGKVGGLGTLENAARVNAGLMIGVADTGAVAHQAAVRDELAPLIDRRNARGAPPVLRPPAAGKLKNGSAVTTNASTFRLGQLLEGGFKRMLGSAVLEMSCRPPSTL